MWAKVARFNLSALGDEKVIVRKRGTGEGGEGIGVFTGVFSKQEGLLLVITSRIKPKILGHVVHIVFKK